MKKCFKSLLVGILIVATCIGMIPVNAAAKGEKYPTSGTAGVYYDQVDDRYLNGYYHVTEFSDNPFAVTYWTPWVNEAMKRGIIYGKTDGSFDTGGSITPKEAATIALRYYFTSRVDADGYRLSVASNKSDDYNQSTSNLARKTSRYFSKMSFSLPETGSTYKRWQAFVYVAGIVYARSQPNWNPVDYFSSTKLGCWADGTKFTTGVHHYDVSSYFTSSDESAMKSCPGSIISANFLMWLETLNGNGGSLMPNDVCSRIQWYKLLADVWIIDQIDEPKPDGQSDPGNPPPNPDPPGPIPEPEPDLYASLTMTASDMTANYYDFYYNGNKASASVNMNASGSRSSYGITGYDFEANSANAISGDSTSSRSSNANLVLQFDKSSLRITSPLTSGATNIRVNGKVTVEDGFPSTDTDTSSTTTNLRLTNNAPKANFTVKTDSISDATYAQQFFYVGEPVTFTDLSSDHENDWLQRQLIIEKSGLTSAVINDMADYTNANSNAHFSNFAGTSETSAAITFATTGTYTIKMYVCDAWGESDTVTKTIVVTDKPAAPTAIINTSSDFIFKNSAITVSDASTDPNNDIVTWTWGNVMAYDTDAQGNPLTTTKVATGYTGSLANKILKSQPNVTPGGILKFSSLGKYDVSLTVTDATGLTDNTSKSFEVIDNVPVLIINPEPGDPPGTDPDITPPLWKQDTGNDEDPQDPHWGNELEKEGYDELPPTDDCDNILFVKENRLVILDTTDSLSPPSSAIVDAETEWDFEVISGNEPIFIQDRCDDRTKTFIPTSPGFIKLTITLHNEYSDNLAETDPTNRSLKAREKTIMIQVLGDEEPEATLSVTDVNPNFANDKTKITVPVQSTATSTDNDLISMYEWVVIRDTNENGDFSDDKIYYKKSGKTLSAIDIPVTFDTTNGLFQVALTVTEKFGQSTMPSKLDDSSVRKTTSYATFDVNWTPDITFTMPDFSYTDDTLVLNTKIKDESAEDCKVEYQIWYRTSTGAAASGLSAQAAGDTYVLVNPSTLPTCNLTNDKVSVQLDTPGYYIMKATITDAEGNAYTFTSDEIRIYGLPTAVISEDTTYLWNNTNWNYKEARKFMLNGSSSYADDEIGEALHEIDHRLDYWTITPMNSAVSVSDILVEETDGTQVTSTSNDYFKVSNNEFYQQLAILTPGKYEVEYVVTNTYGKQSVPAKQIITIAEDTAPNIKVIGVADTPTYNEVTGIREAAITLSPATFSSDDKDKILSGFWSIKYAHDSDNDGNYDEETWKNIPNSSITYNSNTDQTIDMTIEIKENSLGNYKFVLWAKDTWGQETINSVDSSEIKETTYETVIAIENTPPTGTFDLRDVVSGNVVMSSAGSIIGEQLEASSKVYGNSFGGEAGGTELDVMVEAIEGGAVNVANAFNWQQDLSSSIGSISFTGGGTGVNMKGNRTNPGKNCVYILSDENIKQVFTFNYTLDFGDSFNAAGMLFGLKKTGNTLEGYMFSINNTWRSASGNSNGGIWKVTWPLGTNSSNVQKTLIQGIPLATSDSLTVTIEPKQITIEGATMTKQTVALPDKTHSGFGFFADHYNHSCSRIGNFDLKNITLTTSNMKTLEQICNESTWRNGAKKFVIYAPRDIQETMSAGLDKDDPNSYSRLLSLLESQNIHLIIMSSAANYNQMEEFIKATAVESVNIKVTSTSQYKTALNQATEFIKKILLENANDSWWRLVGEDLLYTKYYEDLNGDPQWLYETPTGSSWDAKLKNFWANPSFLAQYFCYYHNANYYDNSMGIAPESGERLNKEITNFGKVGLYNTVYRIKDNPVPVGTSNEPDNPFDSFRMWSKDYDNDEYNISGNVTNPYQPIYVHRRPIASYTLNATRDATTKNITSVTIGSNAYDLDHNVSDRVTRGLQQYRWGYVVDGGAWTYKDFTNEAQGVNWINEMISKVSFTGTRDVRISYAVRDIDGAMVTENVTSTVKNGSTWQSTTTSKTIPDGVWSEPKVVWISNDGTAPIALFITDKTYYDLNEAISITDMSYSPSFYTLNKWTWEVERVKSGAKLGTYTMTSSSQLSTMANNIKSAIDNELKTNKLGYTDKENQFVIKLTVWDNTGLKSETYSVQICISPSNKKPSGVGDADSIFKNTNPIIYEFDDYDDDKPNTYYGNQLRGHEVLDWSLVITDPDNSDAYGPANDTTKFTVQFMMERYEVTRRSDLISSTVNPVKAVTFGAKSVTSDQAKVTANIQPFSVLKDSGRDLTWGAYRITAFISDKPNNGKPSSTTQMTTNASTVPLDLYVIPALNIDDSDHEFSMTFNGIDYELPTEVVPGESLKFKVQTNDRSTGVRIKYTDGSGNALVQEMTPERVSGNVITWAAEWILPEDIEDDDLPATMLYDIVIETYTNYGGKQLSAGVFEETRTKAVTRTIKVLPVKLFDFNISGINDPSVDFDAYPVYVKDLAFDLSNADSLTKLGYAFNFEVSSKGLKKDTDSVALVPSFYGYNDSTGQYDLELDMYYVNNDKYVKMGDSNDTYKIYTSSEDNSVYLGSLSYIELPTDVRTMSGNEQTWTGRYGIPGSAVFVVSGSELTENNLYTGNVLIGFEIDALKNGVAKYDYVAKGQWAKEFFSDAGVILNAAKAKYYNTSIFGNDVPVIVFNAGDNALSNFETRPVWTK